MRFFLLILIISFFSFGDSYKVINNANHPDDRFIDGGMLPSLFYTYRVGLGDFDTDSFGNVAALYCKCLFLVNTVFTSIILLNLFVAIISETFQRIKDNDK